MKTYKQASAYASPWTLGERVRQLLWEFTWAFFCAWTPKPLNFWRVFILRMFGARLEGRPFIHQRARIQQPWKLIMKDRACLGDRANAYTLDTITLEEGATIAQEVYLCTGTHDFAQQSIPLMTAPIVIGANAFIGVRAIILPGVTIGANTVVGAGSVVSRSLAADIIAVGSPAKAIRTRQAAKLPPPHNSSI